MTNPTRKTDPIEFHRADFTRLLDMITSFEYNNMKPELLAALDAAVRQAREDTFNILRDAFKHSMQDDRWQFIQYCLTGWVECGATGFTVVEYEPGQDDKPGRKEARALVIAHGDDYLDGDAVKQILETGKACMHCGAPLLPDGSYGHPCLKTKTHEPENVVYEITHETIELGLQRVRHAVDIPDKGTGNWERGLTSVEYLGQGLRNAIIEADIVNDAGQLDAWGYCAIAEIACFGKVMYG